jgi:hypothetical protein
MKITKRQLKRIIREERENLLENEQVDRAVGLYANQREMGMLTVALNNLEDQVYKDALEDLGDKQDAAEQARMVIVYAISNWASSSGYLDIEDALDAIASYDNRRF